MENSKTYVVNTHGYYFVVLSDLAVKALHNKMCKTFPTLSDMFSHLMAKLKLALDEIEGNEMMVENREGKWFCSDSRDVWGECEEVTQGEMSIEEWIGTFEL
jgi:hypothetical protein